MTDKAVVIGLDMGDGDLIRALVQQGCLPNLAALVEQGTWVDLESPARVLHTSTWPTFATGVLPGRHGVYYPYQPRPGFQEAQLIKPDHYSVPTFWKRADEQGKRCIAYDVPETFQRLVSVARRYSSGVRGPGTGTRVATRGTAQGGQAALWRLSAQDGSQASRRTLPGSRAAGTQAAAER